MFQIPVVPLCILGVCLVLQPWRDAFNPSVTAVIFGYVTISCSGILQTTANLIIYNYPFLQKQSNQVKTLFWNSAMGASISVLGALTLEDINFNLNWTDWLLTLGHCGTFAVILLLQMYISSVMPGVIFTLIGTTTVLYALIAQYSFLRGIHPGNHNWMEVLGVVLMIICVTFPPVIKVWKQRKAVREQQGRTLD